MQFGITSAQGSGPMNPWLDGCAEHSSWAGSGLSVHGDPQAEVTERLAALYRILSVFTNRYNVCVGSIVALKQCLDITLFDRNETVRFIKHDKAQT